ncbi:hypothetical protein D0Y65_000521 [Glycine soja]|uniref:Uncharacterized protein n=1 Tax=Glycine soja TaxID=3848 RepID=A0A445LZ32_GLYSO|nr:hypothetical protein D0Y65_000521 [Glycine soja]
MTETLTEKGRTKHKLTHELAETKNQHLERTQEGPTKLPGQLGQASDDDTAARGLHAPKNTRGCNGAWWRMGALMAARLVGVWSRFQGDPNPGLMRRQLDGTSQCCLLKQAKQEIKASMFHAFDPPPSRVFALRVLELKEQGVSEEQAMAIADMEYVTEKKAKKKAYTRLKEIARLQGKRLPQNPYPSAIKEIQAEERKYVRDRFFNPKILEIVEKQKAEAAAERLSRGGDW